MTSSYLDNALVYIVFCIGTISFLRTPAGLTDFVNTLPLSPAVCIDHLVEAADTQNAVCFAHINIEKAGSVNATALQLLMSEKVRGMRVRRCMGKLSIVPSEFCRNGRASNDMGRMFSLEALRAVSSNRVMGVIGTHSVRSVRSRGVHDQRNDETCETMNT